MSVINSQPLIGASGNQGGAYNLERSLRFRSSASAYLNRTPASAGNRKTWTWSGWVKRGSLGGYRIFSSCWSADSDAGNIDFGFHTDDSFYVIGWTTTWRKTTQVFRDPSAWYHIVVSVDTTSATANNRVRVYVNGSEVTSFATLNNPTQNADIGYNQAATTRIGSSSNSTPANLLDGYLAETQFVDGQALTPSSFGETDTITGVWKPKRYTGTYGTNGFYLKFNNLTSTSTLGNDSSGNSNTWTVNNVSLTTGSTYDSMTDVPTLTSATAANYAVLNQISKTSNITVSDGNLNVSAPSGGGVTAAVVATMYPANGGKYYYEFIPSMNTSGNNNIYLALAPDNFPPTASDVRTSMLAYHMNPSGVNAGQVIGITIDRVNNEQKLYLDNVFQSTVSIPANVNMEIYFGLYQLTGNFNFGQRPFAYTPPSGFVALNTFNLPESTIVAGNKVMDVNAWTGNGSTQTITNAGGFRPDLVWYKARSNSGYDHYLEDSVRGATKWLGSSSTGAEQTIANSLTSFNSNGFSLGSDAGGNQNTLTYVGWQWQAGQGTSVTNTAGSITSTVSANTSAGFSVVSYTGTGSNATVGHGLGVAPSMIIIKRRDAVADWDVYHASLGNGQYISLNKTDAAGSSSWLNNTSPSSTVFTLNGGTFGANTNGSATLAYCWSEIAGFSRFGSYTGNGSTDGVFVYTGFRPKFVMVKRTDTTSQWNIWDTSRNTFNAANSNLWADSSEAETTSTSYDTDFLSNGFKLRNSSAGRNASGGTYIFMAFAEVPTKFALAR